MALDIAAIDHVQLTVPRKAEAEVLDFYRRVLGLAEIEKPPALQGHGGAWFQVGSLQLHIGVESEPLPRSKRHVCFLVPDLPKARAAVVAKNVAIEEENRAEGLNRFFIRDPAGNRLEIGRR